jgi:MFS family permease
MTATILTAAALPRRARLLTVPLVLRFGSIVACSLSFFLPLAVVPLLAGAASPLAGGLANGALLTATVVGELLSPRLMQRFGARAVLGAGLVLLGMPTFLLLLTASAGMLTAVGVLRGLGFALAIVAGGAVTAAIVPAERRGEGLAVAGLVSAVPSLLALPLGVTLSALAGPGVVFAIAGAAPLLALLTVPRLSGADAGTGRAHGAARTASGIVTGLRTRTLLRPALLFAASAAVAGVVVTCVPGALTGSAASLAPVVLLIQPAVAGLGRWIAGRYGDRIGHRRFFVPGILLSAIGMAGIAATGTAALVLAGAAAFGLGFGALQNATISVMYENAAPEQYGTVSALWNAGYDGGMAAGAVAISGLGALVGASPAFLALALALPFALVLIRAARRG